MKSPLSARFDRRRRTISQASSSISKNRSVNYLYWWPHLALSPVALVLTLALEYGGIRRESAVDKSAQLFFTETQTHASHSLIHCQLGGVGWFSSSLNERTTCVCLSIRVFRPDTFNSSKRPLSYTLPPGTMKDLQIPLHLPTLELKHGTTLTTIDCEPHSLPLAQRRSH